MLWIFNTRQSQKFRTHTSLDDQFAELLACLCHLGGTKWSLTNSRLLMGARDCTVFLADGWLASVEIHS